MKFLSARLQFLVSLLTVGLTIPVYSNSSQTPINPDQVLDQVAVYLRNSPELAAPLLAELKSHEPELSQKQTDRFYLEQLSLLAFRGKYADAVNIIQQRIQDVKNVNVKARYLYYLSDDFSQLGRHEDALKVINQAVALLPEVTDSNATIGILQGAVTVFSAVHAYDDALLYADRLYQLNFPDVKFAKCIGIGDRMEIYFSSGQHAQARKIIPELISICTEADYKIVIAIAKALSSINLIDSGSVQKGIVDGEDSLRYFASIGESSNYVSSLEEAIARAYFTQKNMLKLSILVS